MGILERLSDPVFTGMLQSLGGQLPQSLIRAIVRLGVEINHDKIPAFRIIDDEQFPQVELLATGYIAQRQGRRILFVTSEDLANHAQEFANSLNVRPKDEKEKSRFQEYCLMQAMVDLTLQTLPDLSEKNKKSIETTFTEMNF